MGKKNTVTEAELTLGKNIERVRLRKKLTRGQIGKQINETEQQITKFEGGAFVPLTTMEAIAEALGEPIPKRLIRRISFLRKLEKETGIEQKELITLYDEVFA